MNELEKAIAEALLLQGNQQEANKAYLEFIKANFIVPIEHTSSPEAPVVLFLQEEHHIFLPVFTNQSYLDTWATDIKETIQILKLSGVDLLKGIGDDVTICLNPGSELYKEFNPGELARMKTMVLKIFQDPNTMLPSQSE